MGQFKRRSSSCFSGPDGFHFFHVAFAVLVLFTPGFKDGNRFIPSAMSVSLVSLPEPQLPGPLIKKAGPPHKKPEPPVTEKSVRVSPEPEPVQTLETPVSTEPGIKSSLKRKTFKTGKVVEKAVREIEKQVAEERPDAVKKAIDRIREKEKAIDRLREKVEQNPAETSGGKTTVSEDMSGEGSSGDAGSRQFDQIDLYKLEVKYRIQKNWAYSEQLAGRQSNLESLLVIRVMPDGEIKDVWFEKKSGNTHLDDSAYKAILKSNPLPPLPPGFNRPFFTVGMIFTPSGLQ